MDRFRLLGRRLVLSLLAMVVALVLAEILLRALGVRPFPSWSPQYMHVPDDELGLVPAPGFVGRQETSEFSVEVRINAHGLRSPELDACAAPRILLLGDSFAFGHGVEQTETAAARLAAELGLCVQNGGVMSYGTRQATERLRRLGPVVEPALCVLLFFVGNDPLDNLHDPLVVREGWVVDPWRELGSWQRARLAIKHRSALYRVVAGAFPAPEIAGRCSDHTSFGFDLFRRTETDEAARAWAATRDSVGELADAARALECRLVVAAIPTRFQVDEDWWRRHCEACSFDQADFDLARVQTRLGELCAELELPYLDLLPAFAKEARPLYYQELLEMHLNAAGHEMLANELADFLRAGGLLPGG